jgi:hypothetical protein
MQTINYSKSLIHIGYHKTASTFLQTQLFSREDLGFHRWPEKSEQVHELFVARNSFQPVSETALSALRDHVAYAESRGLVYVLSHERLSGHPSSGGYDSRLIADRLCGLMPDASVLIIIREQKSMIRSVYSQYITEGGAQSLWRFLNPPNPAIRRVPYFDYSYFEYVSCIQYYRELFGPEKVLVLPFEMLRKSPDQFLQKIFSHCGNHKDQHDPQRLDAPQVNVRQNEIVQIFRQWLNWLFFRTPFNQFGLINRPKLFRAYNQLFRHISGWVPGVLDRPIIWRQDRLIESLVGDRYAVSNVQLSELIGIDLATYGYDCSRLPVPGFTNSKSVAASDVHVTSASKLSGT